MSEDKGTRNVVMFEGEVRVGVVIGEKYVMRNSSKLS
jgi:hypothetical protein